MQLSKFAQKKDEVLTAIDLKQLVLEEELNQTF